MAKTKTTIKTGAERLQIYEEAFVERMNHLVTKVQACIQGDIDRKEPSDHHAICTAIAMAFALRQDHHEPFPTWLSRIVEGEIKDLNPDKQPEDQLYRELVQAGDRLRSTPIVDDDFPEMAHRFDSLNAAAKKELGLT